MPSEQRRSFPDCGDGDSKRRTRQHFSFCSANRLEGLDMLKRAVIIFVCLAITAQAVEFGLQVRLDRRLSIQNLKGLSPNQVVTLLGNPKTMGPATESGGAWTPGDEKASGPLTYYYYGYFGEEYAVKFEQNQVAMVAKGSK
jgi:hypothetical protein